MFSIVHASIDNFEPERLVGALGIKCIDPGVRSHFPTSLSPRPVLRSGNQPCSYFLAPISRCDIPSLNESDRAGGAATVGVGT